VAPATMLHPSGMPPHVTTQGRHGAPEHRAGSPNRAGTSAFLAARVPVHRSEEIAEAFAATRGITVPAQLRAEIRKDSRDLVGAFRALALARAPIRIQRWTLRRLAVMAGCAPRRGDRRVTAVGQRHHGCTEVTRSAAPARSAIARRAVPPPRSPGTPQPPCRPEPRRRQRQQCHCAGNDGSGAMLFTSRESHPQGSVNCANVPWPAQTPVNVGDRYPALTGVVYLKCASAGGALATPARPI